MRALWIPDRLREFGLAVVEVDGWQTRGATTFNPVGVVCHHTVGGSGEMPSLNSLINGRPPPKKLAGPLCNIGLGRSGTCYVIASGKANHAGPGGWRGLSGNSAMFGIEAENKGTKADPWPAKQLAAYHVLCAALITGPGVGGDVENICGHKEWTKRKVDPHTIDMSAFRNEVGRILEEGRVQPSTWYVLDGKLFGAAVVPGIGGRSVLGGQGKVGTARIKALRAANVRIADGEEAQTLAKAFPLT